MKLDIQSPFLLAFCQPGFETFAKAELLAAFPSARPGFARPGFLTARLAAEPTPVTAALAWQPVFARDYGVSCGACTAKPTEPEALAAELALALTDFAASSSAKPHLRLWERELPRGADESERARALDALIRARCDSLTAATVKPQPGDHVVDVVLVDDAQAWVAVHTHGPGHLPLAGHGTAPQLPAEAPSRAYLKLNELIAFSGAPVTRGQCAVELGSAPGGAALALLERGLEVVGIDPALMHPSLARFDGKGGRARFVHLAIPGGALRREDLPARVDWLLADVNAEPAITLSLVRRLAPRLAPQLQGVLLTLKLNTEQHAARIADYVRELEDIGFVDVRIRQLPSHRRELGVAASARDMVAMRDRAREERVREGQQRPIKASATGARRGRRGP